jgi:hypothetical protein
MYKTGEHKGMTSLGIYELDGSTLRVCLGEPGDPRPTKFHGGGTYTLEVFKREKPEPGVKHAMIDLQRGQARRGGFAHRGLSGGRATKSGSR